MTAGAAFLLCTDGLTKVLDDAEIAAVLSAAGGGQAAAEALADAALARGGEDDVTVVLVEP